MYDCVLMQCLEYVKYSPVIQINNCMHNIFFTKNSIHYINKMHMQIKIEIVNPSLRNSTFNFLVLDTSRMRFWCIEKCTYVKRSIDVLDQAPECMTEYWIYIQHEEDHSFKVSVVIDQHPHLMWHLNILGRYVNYWLLGLLLGHVNSTKEEKKEEKGEKKEKEVCGWMLQKKKLTNIYNKKDSQFQIMGVLQLPISPVIPSLFIFPDLSCYSWISNLYFFYLL